MTPSSAATPFSTRTRTWVGTKTSGIRGRLSSRPTAHHDRAMSYKVNGDSKISTCGAKHDHLNVLYSDKVQDGSNSLQPSLSRLFAQSPSQSICNARHNVKFWGLGLWKPGPLNGVWALAQITKANLGRDLPLPTGEVAEGLLFSRSSRGGSAWPAENMASVQTNLRSVVLDQRIPQVLSSFSCMCL